MKSSSRNAFLQNDERLGKVHQYNMHDFLDLKEITTRKDHECFYCDTPLPAGTRCRAANGRYNGKYYSYHECLKCPE